MLGLRVKNEPICEHEAKRIGVNIIKGWNTSLYNCLSNNEGGNYVHANFSGNAPLFQEYVSL